MDYRAETETLEGAMIERPAATLDEAKRIARNLSKDHITAYAVAISNGTVVGHVAYGHGRISETDGTLE